MTKTLSNSIRKTLSRKETREIANIMAEILGVPKREILESIKLFSNIDMNTKGCLDRLCKIEKKDHLTALMLLEYLLTFGSKRANEIIIS